MVYKMTSKDLEIKRFGRAKLTPHQKKYLLFHVPLGLSNLLEINIEKEEIEIRASLKRREIYLKVVPIAK